MKKNRKRLMAILLAGVMVFSISTMSMADTDTVGVQETSDETGVKRNEADDTSAESADGRALEADAERTEAAGEDPEDGIMMLRADGTPITQSDISGGSLTLDQDGAYYLEEDITASITIGSDSTVTLDLNGKTLTAGSDRPITVNGALTLTDSSATNEDGTDGEGKVTGGNFTGLSKYGGGVYVSSSAAFTLEAGSIEANSLDEDNYACGGGVYVDDSGKFVMKGGSISENTVTASNAMGGGVYVSSGATFELDAGSIEGNSVNDVNGHGGGGVYVDESGKFVMNGGSISENTAFTQNGGGVYIYRGSFEMYGGNITENNVWEENTSSSDAPAYGGGVCLYHSTFTMYGGSITYNEISRGGGAGVCCRGSSVMTMSDGNIDNNKAAFDNAIAEYFGVGVSVFDTGTFNMSGGSISGNYGNQQISGGGVGIDSNASFNMSGGTISDNRVEQRYGGGVYCGGEADIESSSDGDPISITGNYAENGGGLYFLISSGHSAIVDGVTIDNNIAGGNGGGIRLSKVGSDGNNATIKHCNIYQNEATDGAGIYSQGRGTLENNTIKNNTASGGGGGVYQKAYSTSIYLLTMNGGTISENSAQNGGGVYVDESGSSFEMNGGSIENNTASQNGGGVYLYRYYSDSNASHFTMTDGEISKNSAQAGSGGGVYISTIGELTMSGGSITQNTASDDGGGVYIRARGELTMSGGSITQNTASGHGDGVYQDGVYTISGSPVVTDNTSDNVFIPNGKYITIGGSLSGTKNIGVTTEIKPTYASAVQFTDAGNPLYAESVPYFFSDDTKYFVRGNDFNQYDELAMVFSVTIDKVDGNDNPLEGAQFTLTDNGGDTVWFTVEEGYEEDVYTVCAEGTSDATSTIAAGKVRMEGLDVEVNYTLTETAAPDGYKELSAPIVFTVDGDSAVASIVSGPEGVTCTGDEFNVITIPNSENASVSITKTADKDVYAIGETVTYTIDISQTAEDATATAVTFTDAVPDNVTGVRATATINGTTYTDLTVTDNTVSIPTSADLSLAQSDALQIVITGTATSAGTDITNTATVNASNALSASDTADIAIVESASLPNAGGFGRGRLILAGLAVLLGGLEVLFIAVRKRRRI